MGKNYLSYMVISNTINELIKVHNEELVDKLLEIIANNERPKTEKHNKKEDITTSYFHIHLKDSDLDEIRNLFLDLEVSSLTENGESSDRTSYYVDLLNNWAKISEP
jgi:hypothetical protein